MSRADGNEREMGFGLFFVRAQNSPSTQKLFLSPHRGARSPPFPHTRARGMSGGFEDLGLMPELVRATQEQGWL